ncbi:substrate-binding periplasmic protein [Rice orange leaf phytoplasma]|uniref:substrate-binding periplasmic protein n=1 Tax=Rice orange leaf phytoplasma TaxID=146897 RepID=UPI00117AEBC1|nr:transporter substrate-binding domain-containing protein [Rice orange leaf phytoplasma]
MHIKVFAKKHSNPNALKGGIFVGMGPVCLQSDEDASVSYSHLTLEDERLTGFEVLLLKEIAKQQGKELELTINTFAGLLGDIETGKADITASCLAITEDRKAKVDFSIAYNVPMNGFVVRRDNKDFESNLFGHNARVKDKDLFAHLDNLYENAKKEGKEKSFTFIAVTASTTDTDFLGKGYIKKLLNNRDIIKKETSSDNIGPNLEFIRNNKADIFVVDDVIAHYNTEGDKDLKYFILDSTDPQLQSGPNGVGVVVKKGDTKRQKEVNDALRKIFNLEYVKDKDGKDTDVIEDLKYILTRLHELKKEKRTKYQETRYKDLKGKNTRKPEEEKNLLLYLKF